jgi:hypothetical protein
MPVAASIAISRSWGQAGTARIRSSDRRVRPVARSSARARTIQSREDPTELPRTNRHPATPSGNAGSSAGATTPINHARKSFDRKIDADRTAAVIETDLHRGTYPDPDAGQIRFRDYAEQWRIHIRRQVELTAGNQAYLALPKGPKIRSVSLPAPVRDAVFAHVNAKIWKPALEVDIPATRDNGCHDLRYYYASVLLDGGESIKTISERLGHADPAVTLRAYTHRLPSSDGRTRDIIGAAVHARPTAPAARPCATDVPRSSR